MKCRKIKYEKMIFYKIIFDKMYFTCINKTCKQLLPNAKRKRVAYMDEEKIPCFGHLI